MPLTKPVRVWTGRVKTSMEQGRPPFVRHVSERRFRTLQSAYFKLRKLETSYRCNATEASAWVYYKPTAHFHILSMWSHEPVEWYNITWRGLACVAYLYEGAMRRPEDGDKRRNKLPRLFCIRNFNFINNCRVLGVYRH